MSKAWPKVQLGEVLKQSNARVTVSADAEYPNFGIFSYGRGLFRKPPIAGSTTSATSLYRARAGQFVYSRLFAFEGAYGVVPSEFDGYYVSNEFPLFDCASERILPAFLARYLSVPANWKSIAEASVGVGHRRQQVQPEALLTHEIPLPPLAEQSRVSAHFEAMASQVQEVRTIREQVGGEVFSMLSSAHRQIAKDAPRQPLIEVAPLLRRPVSVESDKSYPQIAVRSFGRGTFHKPSLVGSEVTWEKPFLVKAGDILVSNIKAWEGALAVANPEDDGRFGSHRYLTCVPVEGVATARFVCFYLLSREGLHAVGEASPGSADRNRTLSSKAFMQIPVPVPDWSKQRWFDSFCAEVDELKRLQSETAAELDAMLPALLDRAFNGGL